MYRHEMLFEALQPGELVGMNDDGRLYVVTGTTPLKESHFEELKRQMIGKDAGTTK